MVFRLGQFECQDCGHFELPGPTKEELDERALNPFLESGGVNRRKLLTPSTPPAAEPPPPIFRSEPEWHDGDELNRRYVESQALNAEKHTFMAVAFFVVAGTFILHVLLSANGHNLVSRLVGSVVLAFVYTVCLGVPLYYQWDVARVGCMVILMLEILVFCATVVMSIFTEMFGSAWYLIPHIFINVWLLWILWRDRRGQADVTGSGCFWGNPIGWR